MTKSRGSYIQIKILAKSADPSFGMDSPQSSILSRLFGLGLFRWLFQAVTSAIGMLLPIGVVLWIVFSFLPSAPRGIPNNVAAPGLFPSTDKLSYWLGRGRESVGSIQEKVARLRASQEENKQLHDQNMKLKLRTQTQQFECALKAASSITQSKGLKLSKETGSRVGRVLSSLSYRVPEKLSPAQLYSLGVAGIREQNPEKVAAVFSTLTGLDESQYEGKGESSAEKAVEIAAYKTARNYLTAGVAWYTMDNYLLANYYFDEALKQSEDRNNIAYQAQARLWKALASQKLEQADKAQFWLKELLDHHPHSIEASWVNGSPVNLEEAQASSEEHPEPTSHGGPHEARKPAEEHHSESQAIQRHSETKHSEHHDATRPTQDHPAGGHHGHE